MSDQLRKLQLVQLEILKVIDRICRENDIRYSLYAGTLLGAARHQGFIPWDDDLDICMERSEYDRFLETWKRNKPEGYILQNKDNAARFTQSFTKIRKDHTTFLQDESEACAYHTGIFVDVFPIDRMPEGRIRRALFTWDCARYQLYCREFVPPKGRLTEKILAGGLLLFSNEQTRKKKRERLLGRICRDQDRTHPTVGIETLGTVRTPLPPELLDTYTELPFEDGSFLCFCCWEQYLISKFGDYRKLPPESERGWKHHPLILDFEHNYEELPAESRLAGNLSNGKAE